MGRDEDYFTNTEKDAGQYEQLVHRVSRREAAEDAGYVPEEEERR